jgi:CxC1 like cysteine cluster associated with KDZ transposases
MPSARSKQLTAHGLGKHFSSPQKPRDKNKTTTRLKIPNQAAKHQALLAKLLSLQQATQHDEDVEPKQSDYVDSDPDVDMIIDEPATESHTPDPDLSPDTTIQRRITPDTASYRLYNAWKSLLPTLVRPLLSYLHQSHARVLPPPSTLDGACKRSHCTMKTHQMICLYFDRMSFSVLKRNRQLMELSDYNSMSISTCNCRTLPQLLVANGLFPTAPSQPRIAVAINLLGLYRALFEQSCDTVNAIASALHSFYTERGFYMQDKAVSVALSLFYPASNIIQG